MGLCYGHVAHHRSSVDPGNDWNHSSDLHDVSCCPLELGLIPWRERKGIPRPHLVSGGLVGRHNSISKTFSIEGTAVLCLPKAKSEDSASKQKPKTQNHPRGLQGQSGERELAFGEHPVLPPPCGQHLQHPLPGGNSHPRFRETQLVPSDKGIYIVGYPRRQSPFSFGQAASLQSLLEKSRTTWAPPSIRHPRPPGTLREGQSAAEHTNAGLSGNPRECSRGLWRGQ